MLIDKKIKIGFISKKNPADKNVWSGTTYQLYKNIESIDNVEVVWIPAAKTIFRKIILMPFTFSTKVFRKKHSSYFSLISRFFCKNIDRQLVNQVDLLFVPSQALYFAYLETDKPIVYLTDATFKQIYNYYDEFSNFSSSNIKQGNSIHQKAYEKAWRIIVASDWTKKSLINDYDVDQAKVEVIEFGANINNLNLLSSHPKEYNSHLDCLNVLFFGVDWNRKGGERAVEAVENLNKMGVNAVLIVVGLDIPSQHKNKDYIKEFGFLNKKKEEDERLLKDIISKSHILLLPTKAECAGIVFCEASAYGLPIFTCDTGGVANYVVDGKNGYRLNVSATGKDFAEKIKEILDNNELSSLSHNCRILYDEKLNWNVWKSKFINILKELNK